MKAMESSMEKKYNMCGKNPNVANMGEAGSEEKPFLQKVNDDAPKDKFNFVYLIFLLNGFGILMPWNMFTTADAYFREVKLRNSVYAMNFQSYLGISSQLPNLLFCLLNLFVQLRGSLTIRILVSLSTMFLIFLLTIILAAFNTEGWEVYFFAFTMVSVILINCAVGVYQNSCFGLAADLPMKYSNALLIGNNISGTVVAIVGLITMASSPVKRTAAIFYFTAALLSVVICFISCFLLPQLTFYRYYSAIGEAKRRQAELDHNLTNSSCSNTEKSKKSRNCLSFISTYIEVIKEASMQLFNVFFVFFITLTLFPAVLADVRPSRPDFWLPDDDKNNKNYFRAVSCFLMFNLFAMAGSTVSTWIRFPGPRFLWIPVTLRALFLPFFLFSNYRPYTRTLPVLINEEHFYMVMVALMAFTSGYFASVSMMYIPKAVAPEKAQIAAMMAGFFLILGIFCGVNFTFVMSTLVGNKAPLAVFNQTSNI